QSLGLRVPEDISITGFDDLEWARHLAPALTKVRVPWGQMAEIAADVLVAQLDRRPYPKSTMLDSDLVLRDPTAPPRTGALPSILALRIIALPSTPRGGISSAFSICPAASSGAASSHHWGRRPAARIARMVA